MRWRSLTPGLLVIFLVAFVAVLLFLPTHPFAGSHIQVTAHFKDAHDLRANAPVRLAGVEVGRVESVRVWPEMREAPAEIVLVIRTPYELRIPQDSIVAISQAGILGGTFAEIDVSNATGPPIPERGAVLKARESAFLTTNELIENVGKAFQRPCSPQAEPAEQRGPTTTPAKPRSTP